MATGKITKSRVDGLVLGQTLWDSETRGFGVRRQARDATYVVKTRINGRQRFLTIGRHGAPWTPESARQKAKALLGDIANGRDPATARDESQTANTLAQLAERYIRDYAAPRKRARSVEEDRRNLRLHILPALGRLTLAQVTPGAVVRFQSDNVEHRTNANRCLALLSHMFTMAAKWGLVTPGTNPCVAVEKYPEKHRERFLTQAEFVRLGEALSTAAAGYPDWGTEKLPLVKRRSPEDVRAIALIRLLLLTGARLSEIQTLHWDWIDFEKRVARLPSAKSGAKNLYLSLDAVAVIEDLPRQERNPFVLWGDKEGEHFKVSQKAWQRVRHLASLPDVRLHDLRHSFASVAARNKESIYILGQALGHRQVQTTQRYAHLGESPALEMADRTSSAVNSALSNPVRSDKPT